MIFLFESLGVKTNNFSFNFLEKKTKISNLLHKEENKLIGLIVLWVDGINIEQMCNSHLLSKCYE